MDERVSHQVRQHLTQLMWIAAYDCAIEPAETDRSLGGGRAGIVDRVARQHGEIHWSRYVRNSGILAG